MRDGLFVYGTLHPDRAPAEVHALTQRFVPLGTGTVMGRLLNLGAYPGLVLDGALMPVGGEVFRVPEDAWPALDTYEGFNPDEVATSLFRREEIAVTRNDGQSEVHWIYLYNEDHSRD
jgi:gamma-glutamylcyclotransferase (GGCT)/AIG2-like uncharacterized protein YtfP